MTEKTELDLSIEEVNHAVVEITKMDAVISGLYQKYEKVIFDVDKPAGLKDAKAARAEIREPRYLIENLRKDGKRPILELGRQLDARANGMKDRLLALETPIDDAIKEEETRVERERQAKIEAEAKRVETIQERIAEIRGAIAAVNSMGLPSSENVSEFIKDVEAIKVDKSFDEFEQQAHEAKASTLALLRETLVAAKEREAEAARVAAEREELARLRAAEDQRQAEAKAKQAAEEKAARERQEAKAKKEREALAAQRKAQEAEQAKIDAENQRIADERAKLEREQAAVKKKAADEAAAKAKAEADALEAAKKAKFPGINAIINVLMQHFGITDTVARDWLKQVRKAA